MRGRPTRRFLSWVTAEGVGPPDHWVGIGEDETATALVAGAARLDALPPPV